MPRTKKEFNVEYTSEPNIKVVTDVHKIELLDPSLRHDVSVLVEKINELIKKVNN